MPTPAVSQGWLTDILSDEHGISFHRLQMAAWTCAMVGVFLVEVWRTFAMAEFDAMTLALLGISSGTYIGFKFPERR
jgi:ABC-type Mn2+/Zn2+ transport system permease subunit